MPSILTFAEQRDGKLRRPSLEAVSEARRLAGRARGERSQPCWSARASTGWRPSWRAYGADRVHVFDDAALAAYATEAYARALAQVDRRRRSPRSVLVPFTAMGKDLAPRVAAQVGRRPRVRLRGARRQGRPAGGAPARCTPGKAYATVRVGGRAADGDAAAQRVRARRAATRRARPRWSRARVDATRARAGHGGAGHGRRARSS